LTIEDKKNTWQNSQPKTYLYKVIDMIPLRYIWIGVLYLAVFNIVIWLSNNVDVRTGEKVKYDEIRP